jgi:hypothetical protein
MPAARCSLLGLFGATCPFGGSVRGLAGLPKRAGGGKSAATAFARSPNTRHSRERRAGLVPDAHQPGRGSGSDVQPRDTASLQRRQEERGRRPASNRRDAGPSLTLPPTSTNNGSTLSQAGLWVASAPCGRRRWSNASPSPTSTAGGGWPTASAVGDAN